MFDMYGLGQRGAKYLVSDVGWDNIGAVLAAMGSGYAYEQIANAQLRAGNIPKGCEVLFLNCNGDLGAGLGDPHVIHDFVENGGAVYASDYAGGVIQEAFPDMLTFDQEGETCEARCDVVDAGLRETVGGSLDIHFDLGSWWRVRSAAKDVRIYVKWKSMPIVVSFRHGRGHVIYTSFHNERQVSAAEQKLLRFLVLQPVMGQASLTADQLAKAKKFTPGKEIVDTVNRQKRSGPYVYAAKGVERVLFTLQWEGGGTLGLIVQDPSGKTAFNQTQAHPPLEYEADPATPGNWVCFVEGNSVPFDNFPFVLMMSSAPSQGKKPIIPQVWTKGSLGINGPQGAYAKNWSSPQPGCLVVLLDLSSSMNEEFGGNLLGSGKKKADMVATVLNSLLKEFVKTNTVGATVKPRADIAVLGYEGATCRSILGGSLGKRPFVTLPDLNDNPLRIETRMAKEITDDGREVQVPVSFPIWVDAQVGTSTPMCAALRRATELARQWIGAHPDNYPPVVINITDGASTDGDPTAPAHELCELRTSDGDVLLFNCYLTTMPSARLEFPSSETSVPADIENLGKLLFSMSSPIPAAARKNIEAATQTSLAPGARGLILNGDAGSVRQLFVFATVGASLDRNR